jgi:uncharacterized protein YggE
MTHRAFAISLLFATVVPALAQQAAQPQFTISSANRTLSVTATGSVSVEPDVAILHIGFETQPSDAKTAYAEGAQTSNAILAAVHQAGVADSDIHSESQYLQRDYTIPRSHKFKLTQQWTVKTTPARAAQVLDAAITAGANSSGSIDWTVRDEPALSTQALDQATASARQNAATLAKGMGVHLGALLFTSNQLTAPIFPRPMMRAFGVAGAAETAPPPLAIEPQKVTREASVYAVYAIE